jgi:Phage integrase, N-terminal SAM-like domain
MVASCFLLYLSLARCASRGKAATRHAPATIKAYCSRLLWFYRFLAQHQLQVAEVTAAHLTEFVIWLQHPRRAYPQKELSPDAQPLSASSINLIVQQVAALYRFLERRGFIAQSPVLHERPHLFHAGLTLPQLSLQCLGNHAQRPEERAPELEHTALMTKRSMIIVRGRDDGAMARRASGRSYQQMAALKAEVTTGAMARRASGLSLARSH